MFDSLAPMLNAPHEVLHAIYRERPQLLGSAWAHAFRAPLPDRCTVMELDTDVSESTSIDRKVDTLLKLSSGADEHIVIVEAQCARDAATVDIATAERLAELTESGLAGSTAQRLWKDLMKTETFPYQSELHREWNAEGRTEGRAEGAARMVLRVLGKRGIDVPEDRREQIPGCGDEETLERWLDQALIATSIEDLD